MRWAAAGICVDSSSRCGRRAAAQMRHCGYALASPLAARRAERKSVLGGDDPADRPTSPRLSVEFPTRRSPPQLGSTTISRTPIVGPARVSSRRSVFSFCSSIITKRHSPRGKGGRMRSVQLNPLSAHPSSPQCLTHSALVNNPG